MSTDSTRQLVVFSLGEEEYALPITQVHEIIRWTEPRTVASDQAWVRGVISLRGKIVPVYDLAARLGLAAEQGERAKIVIVETSSDMAGVVVDDVEEVLTVDVGAIDEVPAAGDPAIEAIAKIDQRLVVLLDPEGLFGEAPAEPVEAAA
jgi:purine-binding chemotaxis protein CheW